eukprot:jgi/Chlat1/4595/Chrsp290S04335
MNANPSWEAAALHITNQKLAVAKTLCRQELFRACVAPELLAAVKELDCNELKVEVAEFVCNLASYEDSWSAYLLSTALDDINRACDLPCLFQLVQSSCTKIQMGAMTVLGNMARDDEAAAQKMAQSGAVPLSGLLDPSRNSCCAMGQPHEHSSSTVWSTSSFLRILSFESKVKALEIVDAGAVEASVKLLQTGNQTDVESSLGLWYVLAPVTNGVAMRVAEAGGLQPIIRLMHSTDKKLQSDAGFVLDAIVNSSTVADDLPVRNMLESRDHKHQLAALCIMSSCCKNERPLQWRRTWLGMKHAEPLRETRYLQ